MKIESADEFLPIGSQVMLPAGCPPAVSLVACVVGGRQRKAMTVLHRSGGALGRRTSHSTGTKWKLEEVSVQSRST